ncbi:uncharacterized protein TNCV_256451 [Trichonephila clavipes]|nr:uncharacterized protein TNCV_256451 [Trichonephila clavipes]
MLSRIVTENETLTSHMAPESKQNSMEGRPTSSPAKVKAKQTPSKHKILANVFWDRRGVLLVNLMPQGTTINSGAYCATLRKLRRTLQNSVTCCKRCFTLHDNARHYTS